MSIQKQKQPSDELHYAELSSISLSRNFIPGTSESSGISTHAGNYGSNSATLPVKPPAYDYFNEPTVYAQIDHFKTMPNNCGMQSTSSTSMLNCNNSNSVTTTTTMIPSMTGHHQMAHYMSNAVPIVNKTTSPHYDITDATNIERCGNGTLSNSNTMTLSSIQSPTSSQTSYQNHNNQQQSQSQSLTASASKQFSKEIVTIRTPLLYSQQESCV